MPLPLPSLDTRRWNDLVDEARALIPRYAPAWTDHNLHDPGITLMELLAWLVEMDIYQLNRVPAAHKRKFLALVGVRPRGAQPARAVVCVAPSAPVDIPAGAEFVATSADKKTFRFRATTGLRALPASIAAALAQEDASKPPHDVLKSWTEGGTVAPFGLEPRAGAAFWLGFEQPLPAGVPAQFAVRLAGGRGGWDERQRIIAEAQAQDDACPRPLPTTCEDNAPVAPSIPKSTDVLLHHSVRLAWEYYGAAGWQTLDPLADEVRDDTRALTLDGLARVTLPGAMAALDSGNGRMLYFLRVRVVSGEYDAPPILQRMSINGLPVEQALPGSAAYAVAPGAATSGAPGDRLRLAFDANLTITALEFRDDAPEIPVRYLRPATATAPGILIAEMIAIGRSDGQPGQRFTLRQSPARSESLHVFSDDAAGGWQDWTSAPDFDAAKGADAVFTLDGTTVSFGDGDHGRIPAQGAILFARYAATAAENGNMRPGQVGALAPSLANWLLFDRSDFESVVTDTDKLAGDSDTLWQTLSPASYNAAVAAVGAITNLDAASGGAAAETLTHATGRAAALLQAPTRAITLEDYSALALQTPGTAIARVRVLAGQYPAYPCLKAPGVVTVIVVPAGCGLRPTPSVGLLDAVRRYLNRRRIVGTYDEVVAPSYVTVRIQAQVRARRGASLNRVQADIIAALNAFLNPLTGGPAAVPVRRAAVKPVTRAPVPASVASLAPPPLPAPVLLPGASPEPGWPFGRDVYRSEILQVIDGVAGVDNVLALTLIGDGETSDCGNLCVGAAQLVVPGEHSIEVTL